MLSEAAGGLGWSLAASTSYAAGLTSASMPSAVVIAACLALLPLLAAAFFPDQLPDQLPAQPRNSYTRLLTSLPTWFQLLGPAVLCVPYILVANSSHTFHWFWLALYALLPVAVAALLWQARQIDPHRRKIGQIDPGQRGTWRDFLVLATLGLAVDLRWFEPAWPHGYSVFNKVLLLDAGIYGFLVIRQLTGVGFSLRLRLRDLRLALREFALYAPLAIALGLALGFLHLHHGLPSPLDWTPTSLLRLASATLLRFAAAYLFTFFFIAIPEELFFRGWLQNLLERRIGRYPALLLTAAIFGLSHFNKRAAHFNWRYVLLAAIAGIFYGRAWRQDRRIAASAITHASIDTVWSIWLR